MSTLTVSPEYGALLRKIPPKVIRTEKENDACMEILYEPDHIKRLSGRFQVSPELFF